ncbi:ThiF family adenylyltransferase [Phycicoccus duodecadis]|uniref:E2/UBC family protein A n=1 Tax=Phycicoccus duodecadis TaxID=173053 RepID=A0A2N3YFW3_9MICO|nr:ThiF family adenylyltransferase [Phycicoccus duodecadis]PKW25738.1 E2/UBC family protein A [Phycicoccus duodecadis]
MSPYQQQVRRDLADVASDPATGLRIIRRLDADGVGLVTTIIALDTTSIPRGARGTRRFPVLPLADEERFTLVVGDDTDRPPHVLVDHARWVGFPHVMGGRDLCLYLDPSREWDSRMTIRNVLARLWDWLTDAAAGRFDAATSLYHAVGGYSRATSGEQTLVVRTLDGTQPRLAYVQERTPRRVDLVDEHPPIGERDRSVLLMPTPGPFYIPSGSTYRSIADSIETSGTLPRALHPSFVKAPRPCMGLPVPGEPIRSDRTPSVKHESPIAALRFVEALSRMAMKHPDRETVTAVLLVPHPVNEAPSLLALRLRAQDVRDGNGEAPVEWIRISDERPAVTTRRDHRRPTHVLQGKRVLLLGCGGIGSWMGEYIARAGAHTLVLVDPAIIDGGLLTRQNYTEDDIGRDKASALARRIRQISDTIDVVAAESMPDPQQFDLIVDATVSRSVGGAWTALHGHGLDLPLIARVSTDAHSGSLGLVTMCPPGSTMAPEEIDEHVGNEVKAKRDLQAYRVFWEDMDPAEALIPTLGCSVPTYHGSAADLAAVSSTATNLVCRHLGGGVAGSHLFALPHSGVSPSHQFVQAA